ncbi:MAG: hypothetical protein MK161_00080 [Pirellulales bacterium]|nr:hypothetical protein [Pirellulales bacterium]
MAHDTVYRGLSGSDGFSASRPRSDPCPVTRDECDNELMTSDPLVDVVGVGAIANDGAPVTHSTLKPN